MFYTTVTLTCKTSGMAFASVIWFAINETSDTRSLMLYTIVTLRCETSGMASALLITFDSPIALWL